MNDRMTPDQGLPAFRRGDDQSHLAQFQAGNEVFGQFLDEERLIFVELDDMPVCRGSGHAMPFRVRTREDWFHSWNVRRGEDKRFGGPAKAINSMNSKSRAAGPGTADSRRNALRRGPRKASLLPLGTHA